MMMMHVLSAFHLSLLCFLENYYILSWVKYNFTGDLRAAQAWGMYKTRRFLQSHEVSTEVKQNTRVYPKVSGLAAWSENCKWYSSLPLGAIVSLFCESV
jgi:hypothetical protein